MTYLRIILATLVLTCTVPMAPRVLAQEAAHAQEAEQGHETEGGGWLPVIAKAFNFAVLAGVLVYFLKTPLVSYMDGRIAKVREDLVTARRLRGSSPRSTRS